MTVRTLTRLAKKLSDEVKTRFIKILLLYFTVLIVIQLIGIAYILQEPSLHKGVLLAIFLGTILPIILGLTFMKFVKVS